MTSLCEVRGISVAFFFFFQAEDGIRDLVRSRGLGDVYKRQAQHIVTQQQPRLQQQGDTDDYGTFGHHCTEGGRTQRIDHPRCSGCLLYTSDAADERSSVDLGGRRILKKKKSDIIKKTKKERNTNHGTHKKGDRAQTNH